MLTRRFLHGFALLGLVAGCGDDSPRPGVTFKGNCTESPIPAEAKLPAGKGEGNTAIMPGGRRLSPLGRQVELGGFPMAARILPGGKHVLVSDGGKDTNFLSVVDLSSGAITYQQPFEEPEALYFGLAIRASDGRIFVSGGGSDKIFIYSYDSATGMLSSSMQPTRVMGPPNGGRDLIAGLALSNDGNTLYAVGQASSALIAIDANTGLELGAWPLNTDYPNDVVIAPASSGRNEAYVTSWGANQLLVVDLTAPFAMGAVKARIDVGKSPGVALALPGGKLAVASSDADTLSIIDTATRTLERTVPVPRAPDLPLGTAPAHLALSPDGARLYVTDSGENAVDVLDATTFTRIGRFPTGWFPTAVAVADGAPLVVASGKHLGSGPIAESAGSGFQKGGISILTAPTDAELPALTQTVLENANRARRLAALPTCPETPRMNALPLAPGEATPIQHVFVIMRENKTYDAELGDLAGTNGDPSLVLFGDRFTPNLHKTARQFAVLDNFYSQAEASIQGHQWGTSATTTDFTEKAWLTTWGRGSRAASLFVAANAAPGQGYIWQQLERQNVAYVNFGEAVGTLTSAPKDGQSRFDDHFPGIVYNMDVLDKKKGDYVASLLTDPTWPPFTFVLLPNNHTEGDSPGKPTPGSYVADNDEGTGVIVDAISKSKFWGSSVIFIFEDDPQDGGDHVEGHRSPLVVISPWVKRGYVSSANYDVSSMWKTIEHLLGLKPLSLYTVDAAPMYDLFTNTPDFTPYDYVPRMVPEAINGRSSPLMQSMTEAANMKFEHPDEAPGLGRILWKMMKGTAAPWGMTPIIRDEGEEEEEAGPGGDEGWWEIDMIRRYYPEARMGLSPREREAARWLQRAGQPDEDGDDDDDDDDDEAEDSREEQLERAVQHMRDIPLPRYNGEGPPP